MELKKPWRVILGVAGFILLVVIGLLGMEFWRALQASPTIQFTQARHRWEASSLAHYRMQASYYDNYSQCYYDIEIQRDRVVHAFTASCMSSAESQTLTVSGIFKNFEPYATGRVCSPNGCTCEGMYVLRATYDPNLGYPQSITTIFNRDLVYDVLHGTWGVQKCLRTDPVVERFDRVKVSPLP